MNVFRMVIFQLFVTVYATLNGYAAIATVAMQCRSRQGYLAPLEFKFTSCASCYAFLFPREPRFTALGTHLVHLNTQFQPTNSTILADVHNEAIKRAVCVTMGAKQDCYRWTQCCQAAERCCEYQLSTTNQQSEAQKYIVNSNLSNTMTNATLVRKDKCVQTWDGYSCWGAAVVGSEVKQECPSFLAAIPTPGVYSKKQCTTEGKWFSIQGFEWTDYTGCVDIDTFAVETEVSIQCCNLSLIALLPATFIFLFYKSLRVQLRIQLHLHLFASFILTSAINLLWQKMVVKNRMEVPTHLSRIYLNTVGCRVLYVLTRYARCTNFQWMFFEGFFLHRLIIKAFKPPSTIIWFVVIGWNFPILPVAVYSILKYNQLDTSCWINNLGSLEWIIYTPNLFSLVMNLVFLIDIMRILMQVQIHPNEPKSYRRALRATLILVPLFGLQLFFIMYRPPLGSVWWKKYEIVASFITHSQGFFVATILCFVNKEVGTLLRNSFSRLRQRVPKMKYGKQSDSNVHRRISSTDNHDCSGETSCQHVSHMTTSV